MKNSLKRNAVQTSRTPGKSYPNGIWKDLVRQVLEPSPGDFALDEQLRPTYSVREDMDEEEQAQYDELVGGGSED